MLGVLKSAPTGSSPHSPRASSRSTAGLSVARPDHLEKLMESATYWQQLFTQALRVTQRWRAEQARSEGVLAAAAEFQSRLRLLSRTGPDAGAGAGAGAPCVLAQLPDAMALLRGKHLRGLENIMAALRESVAVFAALHAELTALHVRLPRAPTLRPPLHHARAPRRCCAHGRRHHLRCRSARGGSMAVRPPTHRRRSQSLAPVAVRWSSRCSCRLRGSASAGWASWRPSSRGSCCSRRRSSTASPTTPSTPSRRLLDRTEHSVKLS